MLLDMNTQRELAIENLLPQDGVVSLSDIILNHLDCKSLNAVSLT